MHIGRVTEDIPGAINGADGTVRASIGHGDLLADDGGDGEFMIAATNNRMLNPFACEIKADSIVLMEEAGYPRYFMIVQVLQHPVVNTAESCGSCNAPATHKFWQTARGDRYLCGACAEKHNDGLAEDEDWRKASPIANGDRRRDWRGKPVGG